MSAHHIAIATEMKIDDTLIDAWGLGCAELYEAVSEVAHFVSNLEKALRCEEREGRIDYCVSEPLGAYLRSLVEQGVKELFTAATREETGRLIYPLFLGDSARTIITEITGYVPPDPLIEAWTNLYACVLAARNATAETKSLRVGDLLVSHVNFNVALVKEFP